MRRDKRKLIFIMLITPWYILFVIPAVTLSFALMMFWLYFRSRKNNVKDWSNNDNISKLVSCATILTGFTSAVASIVSVIVMIEQSDIQKNLIARQIAEHQPTFIVQKTLYKSDPSVDLYDYEEYSIKNIGERVLNIKSIHNKIFIEVSYQDTSKNGSKFVSYIPLQYYYQASFKTGEVEDIIEYSNYSIYNKNNLVYCNFYREALEYSLENNSEEIYVNLLRFFIISYEDIYHEEHTIYMESNNVVSQQYYESIEKSSINDYGYNNYDLSELNINIFFKDCVQYKEYKGIPDATHSHF